MGFPGQKIYLVRHGETEWTLSGQHTGLTDIPLTKNGELEAALVGKRLQGHKFKKILVSPLQRAVMTCRIAGFMGSAEKDGDLVEWNYGQFEGLKREEIWKRSRDWNIFTDGAPGGETPSDIAVRAARVISKIKLIDGDVALFSHGHFLRALAALWMELPVAEGRHLLLSPSSLSILGYERDTPVIRLWNDTSHLLNKI